MRGARGEAAPSGHRAGLRPERRRGRTGRFASFLEMRRSSICLSQRSLMKNAL